VLEASTSALNLPGIVLNCQMPLKPFWKCQSLVQKSLNRL